MRKPHLLIHMGTNKTGTSYIQRYCADQSDRLMTRGIVYPFAGRTQSTHHPLALGLLGRNWGRFGTDEPYKSMLTRLFDETRTARTVILSSEIFHKIDPIHPGRLQALLKGFDQVSLVLDVRRQDSFAVSSWGSQIKFRMEPEVPSFKEYCRTADLDFLAHVERWEAHADGAGMVVRPFVAEAWKNGRLLDDFMHLVDEEIDAVGADNIANESWPVQSLELLRSINVFDLPDRDRLAARVRALSARFPVADGEGLLTKELQAFLLDRYAERNREMAERYWTPQEWRAFEDQDVRSYEKPYRGLTPEDYATIIAELWREGHGPG